MTALSTRFRPEPGAPLRFERRCVDRWPEHGVATAVRLSGARFGARHDMRLLDCSCDALGAVSETVLEPGTIVAIDFHEPGRWSKRGTVLRCLPCGDGYHVAIQFEARMAA